MDKRFHNQANTGWRSNKWLEKLELLSFKQNQTTSNKPQTNQGQKQNLSSNLPWVTVVSMLGKHLCNWTQLCRALELPTDWHAQCGRNALHAVTNESVACWPSGCIVVYQLPIFKCLYWSLWFSFNEKSNTSKHLNYSSVAGVGMEKFSMVWNDIVIAGTTREMFIPSKNLFWHCLGLRKPLENTW